MCTNAVDIAACKASSEPCKDAAQPETDCDQHNRATQNKTKDAGPLRTKRHANADLAGSLRDGERKKAVEPDRGNHQGKSSERLKEVSNKFLAAEGVFDGLLDCFHPGGRGIRRDFMKSFVELSTQ